MRETTEARQAVRHTPARVELFDETGRLLGVIRRPVTADLLGPGREKVYLAPATAGERPSASAGVAHGRHTPRAA